MKPAWFGSAHEAEGVPCPRCGARTGKPCVANDARGVAVPLTGMHRERIAASAEVRA